MIWLSYIDKPKCASSTRSNRETRMIQHAFCCMYLIKVLILCHPVYFFLSFFASCTQEFEANRDAERVTAIYFPDDGSRINARYLRVIPKHPRGDLTNALRFEVLGYRPTDLCTLGRGNLLSLKCSQFFKWFVIIMDPRRLMRSYDFWG